MNHHGAHWILVLALAVLAALPRTGPADPGDPGAVESSPVEGSLAYAKGNGLRILVTGHSWVAPATRTLPAIAKAAGLDGHHLRKHLASGAAGSAQRLWRLEQDAKGESAQDAILLPAIVTGQWDVMVLGMFYRDQGESFRPWLDLCLKHNRHMVFYLQDGWPNFRDYADLPPQDAVRQALAAHQQMQETVRTTIREPLERAYPGKVRIIPAGAAVMAILQLQQQGKLPGLDTISERVGGTKGVFADYGHLSRRSGMEYLLGYLYYGCLYGRSPELITRSVEGAPPADVDVVLRRVAWETIVSSPWTGIADRDHDGIADAPRSQPGFAAPPAPGSNGGGGPRSGAEPGTRPATLVAQPRPVAPRVVPSALP